MRSHWLLFRLLLNLFLWACGISGSIPPAQAASPTIELLTGNIARTQTGSEQTERIAVTGKSDLAIKHARLRQAFRPDGNTYEGYVTTTKQFTNQQADHIVVRIGRKLFAPLIYWRGFGEPETTLHHDFYLEDVDPVSAQALNGGSPIRSPKESLAVSYVQQRTGHIAKGHVYLKILIRNVGTRPITLFWRGMGRGIYPGRDNCLWFDSTPAVPATPAPDGLPGGFLSWSLTLQPGAVLRRDEDLGQWLQLIRPGKYMIKATYRIVVQNPAPDPGPNDWELIYSNQFPVQVE